MTQQEARDWIEERWGGRAVDRLDRFADLLTTEAAKQNLISRGSLSELWTRHFVDSAQLVPLAPADWRSWLDIGTGAGFPGMIVALLAERSITMVEPRGRRVEFLQNVVDELGLAHASVRLSKVERLSGLSPDVISARAVASIEDVFGMSEALSQLSTTFLLPRGRSGEQEIAAVRSRCKGLFHVEQSLTHPASVILIASRVQRRCSASR